MSRKIKKHNHKPKDIYYNKDGPNEATCTICRKSIKQGANKNWFIDKRNK